MIVTVILLVILTSSGCALSRNNLKPDKDKAIDSYLDAVSKGRMDSLNYIKDNLKLNKTFGYVKPYVPVVEPPQVAMVWIPAHKSKDTDEVLVSGHWVYIMVHNARWFIDLENKTEGKLPIIVPYKETIKK